ncbi:MAG TPA: extracellular matrix/biofilm biosynthesis regulator RemA family protein [Pseudogracilibacillus sp.]|nr:extracellular matrix/biofilm biosynthesis regulator RemA family protein [Pseudogracilibacillus sp.]
MFIYIGNDEVIETKSLICIIDYNLAKETKQLKAIKNSKDIVHLVDKESQVKSIVITDDKIYYSPLSSNTLKKREGLYTTISKLDRFDYSNLNEGE